MKLYNTNYQPDDYYSDGGFRWISTEAPSEIRDDISH